MPNSKFVSGYILIEILLALLILETMALGFFLALTKTLSINNLASQSAAKLQQELNFSNNLNCETADNLKICRTPEGIQHQFYIPIYQ